MNKKILFILAAILILKTPIKFKINAMEKETLKEINKNSYYLEKYSKLTENNLNLKFAKNEYFNNIFKYLTQKTFTTTVIEDLKIYLTYYLLYFKNSHKNYNFLYVNNKLKNIEKSIVKNFKNNTTSYLEEINKILKKENISVNVYYYNILLNQIYDYYFSTLINHMLYAIIHYNRNYKEILHLLKNNVTFLLKDIENFIIVKINADENEKNLITKYFNSLLEYEKCNPGISPVGCLGSSKLKIEFREIYSLLKERLEQILWI